MSAHPGEIVSSPHLDAMKVVIDRSMSALALGLGGKVVDGHHHMLQHLERLDLVWTSS